MEDVELLRYSRQILLPEIGIEGQEALRGSRALIVGAGGLGSPVAMYLAAAGVGQLVLVDHDQVDLSNLQRQIAHRTVDVGRYKVDSAADTLRALNPLVEVSALARRFEGLDLRDEVLAADVVVDACDNLPTRFDINALCVATGTPLVSGAAIRLEGQLMVWLPDREDLACFRCLYQDGDAPADRCAENGVLAPVVGVIGSLQAVEAIKVLTGAGSTLAGRLLLADLAHGEFSVMELPRNPDCPVCGSHTQHGRIADTHGRNIGRQ